jgi:hypothetical protein
MDITSTEIWDGESWTFEAQMQTRREGASSIAMRDCIHVFVGSDNEPL